MNWRLFFLSKTQNFCSDILATDGYLNRGIMQICFFGNDSIKKCERYKYGATWWWMYNQISSFNAHTIKSFGIDCLAYFISVLMKNARYIRHFFASVWLLFIFHLYMEGFIREMHRIEVNKCINGFMWKIPFLIFFSFVFF